MRVSVVIPCFNSEKSIAEVVELTRQVFASLPDYSCEFVLVNDDSKDGTYKQICLLARRYHEVKGVCLMRNFGQHNALMAGLNFASGDLILGMDDDLQTHPSQIPALLGKLREGYDLVYGIYKKKENSRIKNFTSWLNRITARRLLGRPKDIVSSNYWLITRRVRDEVLKYTGSTPYVDAIFCRVTTRIGNVEIEHHRREYGTSNYTFWKLLKLWLAYFNYSVLPLRFASMLGIIAAATGFLFAVATVVKKLVNPELLMGWASLMSAMVFFFGLVLLVIGIIGEYLGKAVQALGNTPQYIVRETVNCDVSAMQEPKKGMPKT